jgi:integrase
MTISMQHLVQEYLEERRNLGFALTIPGSQLQAFARFADASGHRGPLTRQLVTRWARDEAERATPLTWGHRIAVIRPFAKHRARVEPGTYVPEADTFGPSRRRLAPHLYTDREILDLLAAAGRLAPKRTLRPATYRTLFGLIASTGLRLSEALRLTCANVDLDVGMLTVQQTKFAKSRLVPLHPTTVRALKQYLALRQRHVPTVQDGPFLVSAEGTALLKRTVHGVFDRLRKQLDWTGLDGSRRPCHPTHPRSAPYLHLPACTAVARTRHRYRQRHGGPVDLRRTRQGIGHVLVPHGRARLDVGRRAPVRAVRGGRR